MYNAIRFFGSVKELLSFTRSLRVAELLEQEHSKNVHTNKPKIESFSNFGDLLASVGCPFK